MASRGLTTLCVACTFSAVALQAIAAGGDPANLAPRYDSSENLNRAVSETYGTPEQDARPGEQFFLYAVRALARHEYRFAMDMYKTSASWAYKPAEHNLAVMYLKGEGVPVDRPRAMAWMALAAERNDKDYVDAREVIYANLSADEFAQANTIWRELKPTYGDEVALRRAKARWAEVRTAITGSHVGSVGNLAVGGRDRSVKVIPMAGGRSALDGNTSSAFAVLKGGQMDGSVAYRQLRESDNPYDPKFEWRTSPTPTGISTVGPLIPVADKNAGGSSPADRPDPQQRHFF